MATAHDVAAAIIVRQNARGGAVDKMQLQKWLYLVQGAHLAWYGERAFRGEFRAYQRGPVERGVEQSYRDVVPGWEPIPAPVGGDPERVPATVGTTVDAILDEFGSWTATELEAYTKLDGSPWRRVRGDLPANAYSSATIPTDLVADWFERRGVFPVRPASSADRALFERAAAGDEAALAELL